MKFTFEKQNAQQVSKWTYTAMSGRGSAMKEARVDQAMESESVEGILNKMVKDTSEGLFGKTPE